MIKKLKVIWYKLMIYIGLGMVIAYGMLIVMYVLLRNFLNFK